MSRLPWILSALVAVVVLAVLWTALSNAPQRQPKSLEVAESTPESSDTPQKTATETPKDWVTIGGVQRPKSDVTFNKPDSNTFLPPKPRQGFSPRLKPDENPQVASVYKTLSEDKQPEKVSSFSAPKPFDAEAYQKDPSVYLSTVEPSRVFGSKQPGEGVKPILAKSARFHRVKQGESVRLQVQVESKAPVTMTSNNLGSFPNGLTSITVAADESGLAEAVFTASRGTIDDIQILAASPVTSGQIAFTVNVQVPSE